MLRGLYTGLRFWDAQESDAAGGAGASGMSANRQDTNRLDLNRQDMNRQDTNRLDANRLDVNRLGANRQDANRQDANRQDANRQDANRSDLNRSDLNRSDAQRAATGSASPEGAEDAENTNPPGERAFSQADMDRLAQRLRIEFNRRRDRDISDALRAAGLDDSAQATALANTRAADLDAREADITRRELRASALDALARIGLPPSLADALNYADSQSLQTSMEAIERAFRPALQEGIEQRLRGNAPPKAGGAQGTGRMAAYRAALGLPR